MMFDFTSWWNNLSTIQQIYWLVTIPATLLFIIQLVLTFIGGDLDGDGADIDHEISADHGMGFHFMTVKNMIAFFALFGWTGLAAIDSGLATFLILLISTFSGLIMMIIMASIYYFMSKLNDSGTLVMQNAIGAVGDVYISIPAQKKGLGKVQVKVQGALRTLEAMTEETDDIKTGSLIEVMDVINDQILLVKKSK
jgi:hypothetical protein